MWTRLRWVSGRLVRLALALGVCLLACVPAWAQGAGFGLTGGLIRSEVNSSGDESQNVVLEHQTNATGGLFVTWPISETFWIQPEALLSVKGTQWNQEAALQTAGSLRLTYLDLPVLLRYAGPSQARVRIHVLGGGTAGILLNASSELEFPTPIKIDVKDRFNGFDVGWVFGVGVGGSRWHVDLRYGGSFSGITDAPRLPGGTPTPAPGVEATFRNRAFQLLAGVRLF